MFFMNKIRPRLSIIFLWMWAKYPLLLGKFNHNLVSDISFVTLYRTLRSEFYRTDVLNIPFFINCKTQIFNLRSSRVTRYISNVYRWMGKVSPNTQEFEIIRGCILIYRPNVVRFENITFLLNSWAHSWLNLLFLFVTFVAVCWQVHCLIDKCRSDVFKDFDKKMRRLILKINRNAIWISFSLSSH